MKFMIALSLLDKESELKVLTTRLREMNTG